jgi:hypothetical protein
MERSSEKIDGGDDRGWGDDDEGHCDRGDNGDVGDKASYDGMANMTG